MVIRQVWCGAFLGATFAACAGTGAPSKRSSSSVGGEDGAGSPAGTVDPNEVAPLGKSCSLLGGENQVSNGKATTPSIAWASGHYAVAFHETYDSQGVITFALLDETGKKLKETSLSGPSENPELPTVRPLADGYVVAWQDVGKDKTTVRARYVSDTGDPSTDAIEIAKTESKDARPTVSANDSALAFAWMDTSKALYGYTETFGVVLDTETIEDATFPALLSAEDSYALAWAHGNKLGFSLAQQSKPLASTIWVREEAGAAKLPKLAFGNGRYVATWEDTRTPEEQVYAAVIDVSAGTAREVRAHLETDSANWPDIVWTGTAFGIVYYQFRDGPNIFLSLLGEDAKLKDIDLKVSGEKPSKFPSVTWSGSQLGIAWAEVNGPVKMTRVRCD